jgi:hypothetical protein
MDPSVGGYIDNRCASSRGLDCNLAEDQIKQGMGPDVREDLEHLEATHIIPRGRNKLDLPDGSLVSYM